MGGRAGAGNHHQPGRGAAVFNIYFQKLRARIIFVWNALRKKASPDAIIEEQLMHTPDEQAVRIKRRLQENRDRQAQEEKTV
jgi:hypothetical protein